MSAPTQVIRKCEHDDCEAAVLCEGLDVCSRHTEEQLGITYRQLDYWTRLNHLRPENAVPGSGAQRIWPESELEIARRMGRLTAAGLSVSFAAFMARETWPEGFLAPNITVIVTDTEENS